MKKTIIFFLGTVLLLFTGCEIILDNDGDYTPYFDNGDFLQDVPNLSYTIDQENSLTLEGVNGKLIQMVRFNGAMPLAGNTTKSPVIKINNYRYVNTTGINKDSSKFKSWSTQDFKQRQVDVDCKEKLLNPYIPPKIVLPDDMVMSRAINSGLVDYKEKTITMNDFNIGDSREIYIDCEKDSVYVKKSCRLAAKNNECLVWVYNGSITDQFAEEIANNFEKYCNDERQLIGNESNKMKRETMDMDTYRYNVSKTVSGSPTGKLVNIVVYDIGNDAKDGGVAGYFYGRDFYNKNYFEESNEGKYFYLDSYFCHEDDSLLLSKTAKSTLFHEFLHMIMYGKKETDVAFGEMLAMLVEDLMSDNLELGNYSPREGRISNFTDYYIFSGIDEYRSGNDEENKNTVLSYANNYAFGAWLVRNFGGISLLKQMVNNEYSNGMESIVAAIETVTGKKYSNMQLYQMFMRSCVLNSTYMAYESFNKASDSETVNGRNYSFEPIDLSGFKNSFTIKKGMATYDKNVGSATLRPHGFNISLLGKAESDTVKIEFSSKRALNEHIMIFVQDDYSNLKLTK